MFEYHCDPEVVRYVHFGTVNSVDDTRKVIESILSEIGGDGKGWYFAIALKENDKLIGTLDVHTVMPQHRRCEFGWMMTRAYWGHGYMTEAVRKMIRFCFEEMGMHRIEASIDEGNERSERLAERLGMQREGMLRENERSKGRFVSNTIYSILHNG